MYQRRLIPLAFGALMLENELQYHGLAVRNISAYDACVSCKNFVEFGPVTPELTAHLWKSGMTWLKICRISSNISASTGPIFAIFTPYDSALCADDGSVAYFLICQGTLSWQPNNIAKMYQRRLIPLAFVH